MIPKNEIVNFSSKKQFSQDTPPVKVIGLKYNRRDDILHTHDYYEIVLVKSGSGKHITEKNVYSIFHGDIFLIKPGLAHAYEEIKELEIINMLFLPEAMEFPYHDLKELSGYKYFFESDITREHTVNLDAEQLNAANEIILEMKHHQSNPAPGYKYFIQLGFMRLVGLISLACSNVDVSRNDEVTKLVRVLRFIETRYQEKIQINELAAIAGLSPSSLLRAFREEVGETPINYLINLRLEKAAKMLRETTESVSQISYLVGIHDSNYFSKMFKRKYLCSPRKYRLTSKNK